MSSDGPSKSRAELIAELNNLGKPDLSSPQTPEVRSDRSGLDVLAKAPEGVPKFQHAIVNIGTFNNAERMAQVLAAASRGGWELVTVYDKASNWVGGWEKGFLLLKRPIPAGTNPDQWCVTIRG